MVVVDYEGNYLNVKSCQDSAICEVIDEGKFVDIEYKGVKKSVLNITVNMNGKKMIWTPTTLQGRTATAAWGKETKDWIGRKFQTFIVQDKMVIKPLQAER